MKRLVKLMLGTLAVACAWALMPAGQAAAQLGLPPVSCNQQLVDCVTSAAEAFDCCVYAADDTTTGVIGECAEAPAPTLTQRPPTVAKCLVTLNGAINVCNVRFAVCKIKNPGRPQM